jgi:holo-[acyl-carrier protein] synthase
MIIGIGIDLIEVPRIRGIYQRHAERFVNRILTPAERVYVLRHADPSERLAGRWASKEAALKALGTGLADGIRWQDVEILPNEKGKPILTLHRKAAARAEQLGATTFHVTITHGEGIAFAQVILEKL